MLLVCLTGVGVGFLRLYDTGSVVRHLVECRTARSTHGSSYVLEDNGVT